MQTLEKIEKIFLFCAFISLIVVRLRYSVSWISSISVMGVFLSMLDIITHIWNDNPLEKIEREGIYITCLVVCIIIEIVLIVMIITNIASPRLWMADSLFVDEFTIIALMLGVFQPSIISFINSTIHKRK